MPAKLSTYVVDTAHGCPATGMKIELWLLEGTEATLVSTAKTNAEGRTESPLLAADEMKAGHYEIIFFVGDYFAANSPTLPNLKRTCVICKIPRCKVAFAFCNSICS